MNIEEAAAIMYPLRGETCRCGHPMAAHISWSESCKATIHHEMHEADSYSYPCACREYQRESA